VAVGIRPALKIISKRNRKEIIYKFLPVMVAVVVVAAVQVMWSVVALCLWPNKMVGT
jgi:hypothetical protein